jgi:hypothetical protein
MALLFGGSCSIMRQVIFDDPRPSVHVVYAAEAPSAVLDQLLVLSQLAVRVEVEALANPDEAHAKVEARTADLGLLLPAGLDAALRGREAVGAARSPWSAPPHHASSNRHWVLDVMPTCGATGDEKAERRRSAAMSGL